MTVPLWMPPTELLKLDHIKVMALDSETYDPNLTTTGPGFITGDSYPIGFSAAWQDQPNSITSHYYPIAHDEGNLELLVLNWLDYQLSRQDLEVVFANAKYDLEALWKLGIRPKCKITDIQVNESLINENETGYSLDKISIRRKTGQKDTGALEEELIKRGFVIRGKPDWSKLRHLHPKLVGPYAEKDAVLTLRNHLQQQEELEKEELVQVANLESELTPVLFNMRAIGVPVNIDKADELNSTLGLELEDILSTLFSQTSETDPFSSDGLSTWVRKLGHTPPKTAKDNDSVSNEWLLASNDNNLIQMAKYRQGEKIRRDFIEGMILNGSHKGRLHPQWFQTRGSSFMSGGDSNGTRSGRIACIDPNLTQIPSRHPLYGPMVRGLFVPEPGERWLKCDYSSQEPRITVHYAYKLGLEGAAEVRRMYLDNPATDFHQTITDIVNANRHGQKPITRSQGKTINLGLAYGMGVAKLAASLGISVDECKAILVSYHAAVPFMKGLLQKCMDIANSRGYVKTIMGRRRRYDEWENASYGSKWQKPEKTKELAMAKFDRIKRAGTYKAINSIVQGSAAEQTKMAIVKLAREGYTPLMQVYDELSASISSDAAAWRYKDIMENSIAFDVPHLVEPNVGPTWADAKEKLAA